MSNAITSRVDTLVKKWDGWKNIFTGLGIMGRDKRLGAQVTYSIMAQQDAEMLYAGDDMAAKIVDFLPEEMVREGFDIKCDDERFPNLQTDLDSILDELGVIAKIQEGLSWARMYGGAGTIIGIDDGQSADEPLDLDAIKKIEFLNNLSRWELEPQVIQQDPSSKGFGYPEKYRIQPAYGGAGGTGGMDVHSSRMIRWNGAKLPRRFQIQNNYWDDSVLNRVMNPIRNFQASHDAAASLVQDFAQAVYKLKNLTEMLSLGKDDLVQKRLELIDRTRSVVNAIVLEEGEDFDRKVTALAGLPELLKVINQRLVQASGVPHTILLGESPSGLGATGASEKSDWYDYVSRQQEVNVIPQLTQIVKMILLSKEGPTKGVEPKNWRIEARPLEQEMMKDKLANRKVQADTDNIYISSGVLSADEVALSRFGGDDFSFDTKLIVERDPEADAENEENALGGNDDPDDVDPNQPGGEGEGDLGGELDPEEYEEPESKGL